MIRHLLFTGTLVLSSCNTMAGFGDDMAHLGSRLADYARQEPSTPPDAAPATGAPPAAGTSAPDSALGSAAANPTPLNSAPTFAPGVRVTLIKPAVLRTQPSLSAPVVGYAQPGETYDVVSQHQDWVQIATGDKPIAWVFDTFLTVLSPQD